MRIRECIALAWAVALLGLLASCDGVKFADVEVNRPLPDEFKNRTFYAKTDIFKYRLSQLAGNVIVREADSTAYVRLDRVVPEGVVPIEKDVDEEGGEIYRSVVDRGASAEGSYLAFAGSLSANEIAKVQIRDRHWVFIDLVPAVRDAIADWVEDHPNDDPAVKRWYVQGALLASITTDYYQEIDATASGVVGETLGAKGEVYNRFRETATDFRISLELLDIDALARAPRDVPIESLKARFRPPAGLTVDFEPE
jgi:hypothetical protein